jgi:hypothetical protein
MRNDVVAYHSHNFQHYPIFGCITRGLSEFKSGFYTKKQVCGLCGSAGNTANFESKLFVNITNRLEL